eukprot:TRINITY_DN846_c1_g1_i1.p1 TRINITY_DN846_c1_g1~~TRINITY_DN846_c1_g1_i1.p1  ORF type:complete len:176 (+),score=97.69 TRINITY_DN846_c1_g1_i1:67-594(+)
MATEKKGLAVVLIDNQYEVLEFHYPRLRLIEANYDVIAAGLKEKNKYLSEQNYWGFSDVAFEQVDPTKVKILIIPGGLGCPDQLRRFQPCLDLIKNVHDNGGVIGFICHGAWVAISARIVRGRKGTCHPAIKDDLMNAGCEFLDQPVVVDGKLVSAQKPFDLGGFMAAVLKAAEQ